MGCRSFCTKVSIDKISICCFSKFTSQINTVFNLDEVYVLTGLLIKSSQIPSLFIVIDRHVTQGARGPKGRQANERLWTIIGTRALQGRSAYNLILHAILAYFYDEHSPYLLPGFP
jgi:hypothetical protein